MSTVAFVTSISRLQKELATSDKKRDLQMEGRMLFETESLDDAANLDPSVASSIASAASALRIVPSKGTIFPQLVTWALQPNVVSSMDGIAIGRLVHAGLILSDARLFDILMTYVWRVVELAPTLQPVSCAMIINAYGRAGFRHGELYTALCKRAVEALRDDSITMAHIANVANALSRVKVTDKAVFDVVRAQSIKLQGQAAPLVMTTILDAFSSIGVVDEELFSLYEGNLSKSIEECSAPLMTSILVSLVRAKRTTSPLFAACATRALKIAHTYDATSIAKSLDAFLTAKHCSEDFFGALAERACKICADFRVDEIKMTLRALSAFDLFDAELFPLLASRFIALSKVNRSVAPEDAASVLGSFALVHERHEELVHTISILMKPYVDVLDKETFTLLLWGFATLNVRNDTTRAMVAAATAGERLLPPIVGDKTRDTQLCTIRQVYGIS